MLWKEPRIVDKLVVITTAAKLRVRFCVVSTAPPPFFEKDYELTVVREPHHSNMRLMHPKYIGPQRCLNKDLGILQLPQCFDLNLVSAPGCVVNDESLVA